MPVIINSFIISSPAEIITANRVADWDADLGITTDGDGVTNWADQDANVGDLFAESAARSPALITNGNPAGDGDAIEFDGIANRMRVTGGFTLNQPVTLYSVMKQRVWTSGREFWDGNAAATMLTGQQTVTPRIKIFAGSAFVADNDLMVVDTWFITAFIFNGASSSIRLNNNTKTTGNPGTSNPGGFVLGSRANNINFSACSYARLLLYDTVEHSLAEQNQNIDALNAIYSVF